MTGYVKLIKKKLFTSYIKNMVTLTLGTLIAQCAIVIAAPALTRLYSPEQLGMYTLIFTIASIIGPLVNGRYDMSIVSASHERESHAVMKASMLVCFFISALAGIIITCLILFDSPILVNINSRIIYVFPLLLLFGFINAITSYNNRNKEYKLIAKFSAVRTLTLLFGQVLFGVFKAGITGLLVSQLASFFISLLYQLKNTAINYKSVLSISFKEVSAVLRKFRNQPFYSTPALLLNSLSYSIIPFLISTLYGLKDVGYYSLSFTLLGMPIQLFSVNVAKVFFEKANREKKACGNFYKTFKTTLFLLLFISIPFFTFLMLFSRNIFNIVFGPGWERAGLFVEILSPMYTFRFISASLAAGLIIGHRQKIEFIIQSVFFIEAIGAFLLSKQLFFSIEQFLTIISILFAVSYIVLIFAIFLASKSKD